jgi:hypothetical protein
MTTFHSIKKITKRFVSLLVLTSIAALSACGGGGGGGTVRPDPKPPVTPPQAAALAQEMKTRIADGFTVQVTPYAISATDVPVRFEVSLTDATKVTGTPKAYFGVDFAGPNTEVTPTKTSDGWSVAVPANVAKGSGLLLSFTLANGDTFETGTSDFTF